MTFETYRSLVIAEAKSMCPQLSGICCDSIRDSFNENLSVTDAAITAGMDSEYWETGTICLTSKQ